MLSLPLSVFSHYLIEIGPQVTLDHESLQIPKVQAYCLD